MNTTTTETTDAGWLCDYDTTARIRRATHAEREASVEAARNDGGAGVIAVDGRRCYVEDGAPASSVESTIRYTVLVAADANAASEADAGSSEINANVVSSHDGPNGGREDGLGMALVDVAAESAAAYEEYLNENDAVFDWSR